MERHYGMDWLRIGAFALLVLYHIGMVFVPWGFHVKTAHPAIWVEIPMYLTSPWRLTLLFVVSGYASRALLAKSRGIGGFVRNRNARLLLPLVFGVAFIIPPQTWVELSTQHGYAHGFAYFYAHDYFRFGTLAGIVMPTWNHLWFVLYLWVYTLGLALTLTLPGGGRAQAVFDRVFGGARALVIPALYMLLLEVVLFHRIDDTHDLINDGVAHLRYVPAFLFGFGLAGSPAVMGALAARWRSAAALAIGCFATIATLLMLYPDFSFPNDGVTLIYRIARHGETWTAIAALIGLAERYLNRNTVSRSMLTEAVFPFYIIHQTMIVVVERWLLPDHLPALAEFAILIVTTIAGCWAFYLIGRKIAWLRPLIGLRRVTATATAARSANDDDKPKLDVDDPRGGRADRAQPDRA